MADRFALRFGFLTSGYQVKYFYWEVFIILRKTIIVLLITLLAPLSKGLQSLTTISVLLAFLTIHIRTQPFNDKNLNDLEAYSLMALILTVYFGLYYQSSQGIESLFESSVTKWLVFFFEFTTSLFFLSHFVYKLHAELVKLAIKKKRRRVFNILTCGCSNYYDQVLDQIQEGKEDLMASKFDFIKRNTRSGSIVDRNFSGLIKNKAHDKDKRFTELIRKYVRESIISTRKSHITDKSVDEPVPGIQELFKIDGESE